MKDTYIFAGPTISKAEAESYLEATYLPPAAQADVVSCLRYNPKVIGIIDGYFDSVPAVWHKEILLALSQGVQVVGAASMGALRAAELHTFGMVGIGEIFQWYRDGIIEADDEVAIQHAPKELGYHPLSEALVNIRKTIRAAREATILSQTSEAILIKIARKTNYPERTYKRLIQDSLEAGLPKDEISRLEAFVSEQAVDLKKDDAIEMLKYIAQLGSEPSTRRTNFELQYTTKLDDLIDEDLCLAEIDDIRLTPDLLINYGRLKYAGFRDLEKRATVSHVILGLARHLNLAITDIEFRHGLEGFMTTLGFNTQSEIAEWSRQNHLTESEFEQFIKENLLIQQTKVSFRANNRDILRQMRLEGKYGATVAGYLRAKREA